MRIEDLWIGDLVRLKKSGRIGKFEGEHPSGRARISIDSKIILSSVANLESINESQLEERTHEDKIEKKKQPSFQKFEDTIDLHIEKLQPSLRNEIPQMIINKQVAACRAYLQQAIELKRSQVVIIHGKGEGQLKLEVEMILKELSEVQYFDIIHDGGATLVGFQYSKIL